MKAKIDKMVLGLKAENESEAIALREWLNLFADNKVSVCINTTDYKKEQSWPGDISIPKKTLEETLKSCGFKKEFPAMFSNSQ